MFAILRFVPPSARPPGAALSAEETRPAVPRPREQRIPELDGFRAIAVWAVVIHHAFYGWNDTRQIAERFPRGLQFLIDHGWMGVDLFFVLSGFLITGILLDTRADRAYFKNFYIRRVLRIFPLYFCCIALMSLGYREYGSYFVLSI